MSKTTRLTRRVWRSILGRITYLVAGLVPPNAADSLANEALRLRLLLQVKARRARAAAIQHALPVLRAYDGSVLRTSILEKDEPWRQATLVRDPIPGMLTDDELRYYAFISKFYAGVGEVVEVGTWLGLSTLAIARGLRANPRFAGKLHCFDDFVWRSHWMDPAIEATECQRPQNHESFESLFRRHIQPIETSIEVHVGRLVDYDGNEDVRLATWSGSTIEMCFVDCGRQLDVNEAWYRLLSPYFIPDRTLLILQDWQNHKTIPEVSWENMKLFTDGKGADLELLHEIRGGALATFLYRGPAATPGSL